MSPKKFIMKITEQSAYLERNKERLHLGDPQKTCERVILYFHCACLLDAFVLVRMLNANATSFKKHTNFVDFGPRRHQLVEINFSLGQRYDLSAFAVQQNSSDLETQLNCPQKCLRWNHFQFNGSLLSLLDVSGFSQPLCLLTTGLFDCRHF